MRLQLMALLAFVAALLPSAATATDWVGARNDVYADEWIVVISPAALARADIAEKVEVEGGFALDILSGATPVLATDAMTSATYFSEARRDTHLTVKYAPAETWDLTASALVSVEPDHVTATATGAGRFEAFQRMTTFGLSYSFLHEQVGTVHDPNYSQLTLGHIANLSVSQILTKKTNLTFLVSGQYTKCEEQLGCQANPYRAVPVLRDDGTILVTPSERHDDQRLRGAAAARLYRYLAHGLGLQGGYRFYADTWQVMGHTGDVALVGSFFGKSMVVRAEGRFTWQEPAAFFRARYETDPDDPTIPEFRSGDRELARMFNVMGGARLEYRMPNLGPVKLGVNSRLSRIWYRYLNYPQLPERNAWLMGIGLNGEF